MPPCSISVNLSSPQRDMTEQRHESSPVAVFCSINRPDMLHESILCAVRQTVPCHILVSVPDEKDISPATRSLPSVKVITGSRGLTAQRNLALKSIEGTPEPPFVCQRRGLSFRLPVSGDACCMRLRWFQIARSKPVDDSSGSKFLFPMRS